MIRDEIISATRAKFPHMTDEDIAHVIDVVEGSRAATPMPVSEFAAVAGLRAAFRNSVATAADFERQVNAIEENDDGPV